MDWRDHRKEEATARDRIWQTLQGVGRLRARMTAHLAFLLALWLMVATSLAATMWKIGVMTESIHSLNGRVDELVAESHSLRTEFDVSSSAMLAALETTRERFQAAYREAEAAHQKAAAAETRLKELETVLDLRNTVSMDFLRTIDKQSADALAAVEKLDPHKTGIQIAQLQLAVGGVSDAMREIALDVEELTERPVTTCECPMVSACPCEPADSPPPPPVVIRPVVENCPPRFFPRLRRFWK